MTVSKTTTQEQARLLVQALWRATIRHAGETWQDVPLCENIAAKHLQQFADSLTAELQKENARLREALENLAGVMGRMEIYTNSHQSAEIDSALIAAGAALSKEKAK